jgi:hypothetical protein
VRFGPGEYRMGGSLKGGASTMWFPSDEPAFRVYQAWNRLQGFQECADHTALHGLTELLKEHQIELVEPSSGGDPEHYHDRRGHLYRMTLEILKRLPESHLNADAFQRLQLGGGGPDNAKGSAFDNGTVIMYSFATDGARRTYYGLFLHELGHLHAAGFTPLQLATLQENHAKLRQFNSFLGIEFLLGAESREQYQAWPASEFLAETYLHYVACGSRLRNFLQSRSEPDLRAAWERVYEIFMDRFEGMEYL